MKARIKCHSTTRYENAILNKLSFNLKSAGSVMLHMPGGNLFQSLGAATAEAGPPHSLYLDSKQVGYKTTIPCSACRDKMLDKYGGEMPLIEF